jgi:hypothetical protein
MLAEAVIAGAIFVFGYFSNRPRQQDFDVPAHSDQFDPPDPRGEVDDLVR